MDVRPELTKRKPLPRSCKNNNYSKNICIPETKKPKSSNTTCVCIPMGYGVTSFPSVWNELRIANQLSDGNLDSSDNVKIPVHRAILSAVSPYFKVLFTNTLSGKQTEKFCVKIDLPFRVIQLILDFAYTGHCVINKENVQELLVAADRYEVLGVVQKCCHFLLNELNPENCLGIMRFAKHYFCQDLLERGIRFIHHHFKDIVLGSSEFLDLPPEELYCLMVDDQLNVRNEELVFEAIIKWIASDEINREPYFLKLSQCPRYGLMAQDFFTSKVITNPYVLRNESVRQSMEAILLYVINCDNPSSNDLSLNLDVAKPRLPYEVLFAIGGWSAGSPTSFVETYDTRADKWFLSMNTDSIARAYHGICTLHNLIYMIGGFDGSDHFNTMRCYNPETHVWSERACMYHARCYVSVCALDGLIYAMGGFNGRNRLRSVERYHPNTNQWEIVAPMNHERSDGSATTLHGKIFVAGGFNGTDVLNTVEVFDPKVNQWTYVTSMSVPRSGVSLVAYRDRLYALGGFNGFSRLQSGESFDPIHAVDWHPIAEMYNPRSNFAAVNVDDMIFVIGGFDGATTITHVECYDGDTDSWFDAAPLNLNRSALGACALAGLPNAREFSYIAKMEEASQGPSGENTANQ